MYLLVKGYYTINIEKLLLLDGDSKEYILAL